MERVVDLKHEPIVGMKYLVPCVFDEEAVKHRKKGGWVPIFGDAHSDLEFIGVPEYHWHIDWRFVGHSMLRVAISFGDAFFLESKGEKRVIRELERECLREMPAYGTYYAGRAIPWLGKLEDAFAASTVVNVAGCRTCPHRGLPLDGLPKEKDGSTVCRGHGLCWAEDGTMIRRVPLRTVEHKVNELGDDDMAYPVLRLLKLIEDHAHQRSDRVMDFVRHIAFGLAIDAGFKFGPDEMAELAKIRFHWGDSESRYRQMIEAGNISACQSLEKYLSRPPMIWEGKRLFVGAWLTWEGKQVKVTSFGADHRGHYVGCCAYRGEKPAGSGYERKKVAGRLKIYQEELRKGERARNAPIQDKELLRFARLFHDLLFHWDAPKEELKFCRTMQDWWNADERDGRTIYGRKDQLEQLLVAIEFPVPLHVAKAWNLPADVKAFVGDFDTKVLPLIRAEMKRRAEKARQKKVVEPEGMSQ